MSVFFTSDTHFGHKNIITHCNRPWATVEEMDEALIEAWNSVVEHNDVVYHLGDVSLSPKAIIGRVSRLNGIKILIPGNHDKNWHKRQHDQFYIDAGFYNVWPEINQLVRIKDMTLDMSHLPYTGDSHGEERYAHLRPKNEGLPLICGHVHDAWQFNGNQFNVGVDANPGYAPVHEDVVRDWIKSL